MSTIFGALRFNVGLTISFMMVGIWPASKETAPMSVKGPLQIWAAWLGGQQIFPIANHGFFVIELKADFSPLFPLPQGVQHVLIIDVDGGVDGVVCLDYLTNQMLGKPSVVARSVLGKNM